MPNKKIKPFVFNDETVANTYGFYILTAGIDLTRFEKNPVMLSDHWNSNWNVLGNWTEVKKNGTTLTGIPVFDTDDEYVAPIAGKVERGFIKGCSMGIIIDRENLTYLDGKIFLTKCELAEVSITPVPSNANAIRLMNPEGELISEQEIKNLCLSVVPGDNLELNLNLDKNMKKIILSIPALMALGFKDQPTEGLDTAVVDAKIIELSGQVATLTKEKEALELAAKDAKKAQEAETKKRVEGKVDLAITQGQFTADKREEMISLGLSSETALDTVIKSIPVKQNFSAGVQQPTGNGGTEVKTAEDFQKLSHEAQLAFKNDNPEEYQKLFK